MKIIMAAVLAASVVASASGSDGVVSEVVYKDGSAAGVKVLALGSASSLAQSGVKPGDVVTRVDHRVATTSDIGALSGVPGREGPTTTIELVRGNETRSVQVARATPALPSSPPRIRMVPAFRDGKCIGMEMFNVSNDSTLAKKGLRDGDTWVRVNGIAFDSPENALKAYGAVKADEESKVEVLRDGKSLELSLNVSRMFSGLTY